MTTLPMDPRDFWPLAAAVGLAVLTLIILFALNATAGSYRRPAWEDIPESWRGTAIFLGLLWLGLFALTVVAAYVGVWDMIHPAPGAAGQSGLGLGALLAAMLGSPFVIWGTWLKYQTVRFQKEGHMTDRISKAVEQLGAEKTVDRIGRPVTIWGGKSKRLTHTVRDEQSFKLPERTLVLERVQSKAQIEELYGLQDVLLLKAQTWEGERTIIEWQGEQVALMAGETIGAVGAWAVFRETVPNIEVRIGAILSLERIAQDSTIHDQGRDHVLVMQILCAYVRENSNARKPVDFPEADLLPPDDTATLDEQETYTQRCEGRFGELWADSKAWVWAKELPAPRVDVVLAMQVLGRRTKEQRRVESAWPQPPNELTAWPFDLPCPKLSERPLGSRRTELELTSFQIRLEQWQETLKTYQGYRLDLRGANLQGIDLAAESLDSSGAVYCGALFCGARLEGARLRRARISGANLRRARMEGADLEQVQMEGTDLTEARMEGAYLSEAQLVGGKLHRSIFQGAHLECADLAGADLWQSQLESAYLGSAGMEGTRLGHTFLDGSDVEEARMDGAYLSGTRMKAVENLGSVTFALAAARNIDLSIPELSHRQIDEMFGDASVTLPKGLVRPGHWPDWVLPMDGEKIYESELSKWRAYSDTYETYEPPRRPIDVAPN